ncbi:MAG: DUF5020 family protein [Bacteroidales bacterium]|nr:DUF5020 family protein [Bacteroidales bacterium]
MKQLVIAIIAVVTLTANAQNIQLHYDTRHTMNQNRESRNYMTATYEMLKFDKLGSWFMFIDADFNQKNNNVGTIYTEISRTFQLGKCPVQAHIEFNGGLFTTPQFSNSIENAYLLGGEYPFRLGGFNLSTYVAYKYNNFAKASHDAQWTAVWEGNILNDQITISGFLDVWSENKDKIAAQGGKKIILMTEPQIWYNVVPKKFSIGSEVEISSNFYPYSTDNNHVFVYPTLAVKYIIE